MVSSGQTSMDKNTMFYHFVDHGNKYHSSIIGHNRVEIQDRFTLGWLSWAGTPNEVILDSASEFVFQSFSSFLQSLGVKATILPPNAHWRIERHGGILQTMLSKYKFEHEITNYSQLQQALAQRTMAKNTWHSTRVFPRIASVWKKHSCSSFVIR